MVADPIIGRISGKIRMGNIWRADKNLVWGL